jgi:hypothetical protein
VLPFGPITNAEQLIWQARATQFLAGSLDVALRADLPSIRWTIGTAGSALIGRCRTALEWDRWQDHLQLPNLQPAVVHAGYLRRIASGTVTAANGLTTHVTLIADLDLDDGVDQAHPPRDAA